VMCVSKQFCVMLPHAIHSKRIISRSDPIPARAEPQVPGGRAIGAHPTQLTGTPAWSAGPFSCQSDEGSSPTVVHAEGANERRDVPHVRLLHRSGRPPSLQHAAHHRVYLAPLRAIEQHASDHHSERIVRVLLLEQSKGGDGSNSTVAQRDTRHALGHGLRQNVSPLDPRRQSAVTRTESRFVLLTARPFERSFREES
jgi:hypothetical protein